MNTKRIRIILPLLLAWGILPGITGQLLISHGGLTTARYCTITGPTAAYGAEADWKDEFADVCSKTDDAMTFTKEELKSLVERCDRLKPIIEKLDESQRKVYRRRLQMCRDLFAFVLESKENN